MSDTARISPLIRWLAIAMIFVVVFLGLVNLVTSGLAELPVLLVIGWSRFLARTLPRISLNLDLVFMALLSAGGVLLLTHWLLKWLTGQIAAAGGQDWHWPWRWTWCGASAVAVAFLVGMSVGGIAHQIGWIVSSPEPWREVRGGAPPMWTDSKQLRLAIDMATADANGDLAKSRRQLRDPQNPNLLRSQQSRFFERYNCLLILEGDRKIVGAILFPRDASRGEESQQLFYWKETDERLLPMSELPTLVKQYQRRLMAL